MSEEFCTPRERQGTEDAPAVRKVTDAPGGPLEDQPLLPPRSESEQRQDDADEVPTH